MKQKSKFFIWASLIALFLMALSTISWKGPQYFNKSYYDSDTFQWQINDYYNFLGRTELNPIQLSEIQEKIPVSNGEIEEHRLRYGPLIDQLESIREQYTSRIEEAKAAESKVLEESLIEERDRKMEDIRKNFESNDHIAAKIRAEKMQSIEEFFGNNTRELAKNLKVVYKLEDVETGEVFSNGDVSQSAAFKEEFNDKQGYFIANSSKYTENHTNFTYRNNNEAVSILPVKLSDIDFPDRQFKGVVIIPKKAEQEGNVAAQIRTFQKEKMMAYGIWAIGAIALILVVLVIRFQKEWVLSLAVTRWYDRWKIDMKVAMIFFTAFFIVAFMEAGVSRIFSIITNNRLILPEPLLLFIFLVVAIMLIAIQLVSIVNRFKQKGLLEKDLENSYTAKFFIALQKMFLNRSIGVQQFILLIGFFLAGFGLILTLVEPTLMIVYVPCVLFLGLPALYIFVRRSAYLSKIIVATEEMAAGKLHEEIAVEGKSPLAKHAHNLNNLREGVRQSMNEQAKSERLKTELITNVSHDLRTPLTSIITYTDLLKSEGLSQEERKKYIEIIDKKSQRLKTLINDLFEVSKMASGNLELNRQYVDLTQLLQQALGEHEEDIAKSNLNFRMSIPEQPVVAFVDGQRWWRMLDNLIVNAIKYSLPGTRVYLSLEEANGVANFELKNITKYELGENVEELFERFKRGDASRHTDGSGLGLAIAQSIVDMHGAKMKIELDGDLFKVIVSIAMN